MLDAKLLGQFDVQVDGRALAIGSRSAQALFAYLLLNPGTAHRREKLAGTLWPDNPDATARRNLRQALWMVRRALSDVGSPDGVYLLSDDISIAFNSQALHRVDAAMLDGALGPDCALENLLERASLYQGELLPGFYEDWFVLERERLETVFDQVMQLLLNRLIEGQRWQDVLTWGERWIALGHVPEPGYRALMAAHASQGDLAGMSSAYQRCREALRSQLGVEPSALTLKLYETLRAGDRLQDNLSRLAAIPAVAQPPPSTLAVSETAPAPGKAPFRGLRCFEEADAALFFGRDQLVADLAAHLRHGDWSFTAVVGASGSGKSSLVRAGLVPALQHGPLPAAGLVPPAGSAGWPVHVITPSARPLEALAVSLARNEDSTQAALTLMDDLARDPRTLHMYVRRLLSRDASRRRLLLVVDQFEEVFTLCRSETERRGFIDNLLEAAWDPDGDRPTVVVITLRADFYAHCAQYGNLRSALSTCQRYIGAMNAAELRQAIEEPARAGGWAFEPGLVELFLRDTGDEPGALPLLSHALLATWERRRDRTMTLEGYAEAGGVRGAVARTAEHVYHGLSPAEQATARGIFLRLTALGEGTQDTRRCAARAELDRAGAMPVVDVVLQVLAEARLITIHQDTVEIAHEALIREWPTLRGWLAEDRDGLRLQRHLTEAAQSWDQLGHDPGDLYRGARLVAAGEWAATHPGELNPVEESFLAASRELAGREAEEREAQRQRELQTARRLAAAQRSRAMYLGGGLVLAAVLALIAVLFARQARSNAGLADAHARVARAREWAAAAVNNLDTDPERSVLLALQAVEETYRVDRSVMPEAEDALHRSLPASRVRAVLRGHSAPVNRVAFLPPGPATPGATRLATESSDGTSKTWALSPRSGEGSALDTELLRTFDDPFLAAPHQLAAFNADGTRLAVITEQGLRLWDSVTGLELRTLLRGPRRSRTDQFLATAVNSDGSQLAVSFMESDRNNTDTYQLYDTIRGREVWRASSAALVEDFSFSPDGNRLAMLYDRGIWPLNQFVEVVDTASGKELLALSGLIQGNRTIAFSPNGKLMATGGADRTARIWDAATGKLLRTLSGHTGEVVRVAFSPDGTLLATASLDWTAKVWSVADGHELMTLRGHTGGLTDVAFEPAVTQALGAAGPRIATASLDGTARVWDAGPGGEALTIVASDGGAGINEVTFSPRDGGARLATAGRDGAIRVWDTLSGSQVITVPGSVRTAAELADMSNSAAFSPDGRRLAIVSLDRMVTIRDAASGEELLALSPPLSGPASVAFNPDGSLLATPGVNGKVKVWDAHSGAQLYDLGAASAVVNSLSFSQDGAYLATANRDGAVQLWRLAGDPAPLTATLSFAAHEGSVWSVAFSPDGSRLASSGHDGRVKLWDLNLPDGRLVQRGSSKPAQLLLTLAGHTADVRAVAFSPDGRQLATGSADTTTKIWDANTGQELFTLTGTGDVVSGVAFSPDGTRLASASLDGTVHIYDLRTEDLVALAKSRVTRELTPEECRKYLHLELCPPQP